MKTSVLRFEMLKNHVGLGAAILEDGDTDFSLCVKSPGSVLQIN